MTVLKGYGSWLGIGIGDRTAYKRGTWTTLVVEGCCQFGRRLLDGFDLCSGLLERGRVLWRKQQGDTRCRSARANNCNSDLYSLAEAGTTGKSVRDAVCLLLVFTAPATLFLFHSHRLCWHEYTHHILMLHHFPSPLPCALPASYHICGDQSC